ncbi:hypothetical protein QTI24_04975 [Variovorax sp. J22P240]|uniref:hypothetical protein n=1 Tax=Variovorax sp. J22P240 TaxID=3053514 RepID=UPI002574E142|nr:hypothetical protein [Variovorax sp. J22P240]MDL9997945.1 hypothetical protein [Variovorax sp. J22P240]
MSRSIIAFIGAAACCIGVCAEELKLPIDSDDKGTVYINPNLSPTEGAVNTKGATVGMERPDGGGVSGGVDTSKERPTYSLGASTGGKRSYSAGAFSDGKNNAGVKAGVTIKY